MDRDAARIPNSLTAAMILQFAVGGAVFPFISLYLRDQGLSFPEISRIFLMGASTLLLFPFLWGMLADRLIPLNRLFLLLNALAVVALVLLGQARGYVALLVAYTFFHAVYNPTPMLMNALCFPHLRNPSEQFGPLRAWGSLGWILPSLPIFLWLALSADQSLRFTLALGCGFAVVAAMGALRLPHTPPGARQVRLDGTPALGYWPAARRLLGNPDYRAILLSFFLVASSFAVYGYYSSPRLEDLGMSRAWIGPVQSTGVVLEIILFRWRTRLIGRGSYATPILAGCAALLLRQLLFAWCGNLPILAASYLLVGVVVVFYHIGVSILVDRIASPEVRSTAQTLLVLCGSGLGPMFANWGVGWITRWFGPGLSPVFIFGAVLAFLAGLVIWMRRGSLGGGRTSHDERGGTAPGSGEQRAAQRVRPE
jgi:MFS transporter, PPP family, 3-phenylpropionic acid transporter